MKKIFFIYLVNLFFINQILFAEEEANLISDEKEIQNSQLNKDNNQEKKHSIFIGVVNTIPTSKEIKQDIIGFSPISFSNVEIIGIGSGFNIGYNYAFLPKFRVGIEISSIQNNEEIISFLGDEIYKAEKLSHNKFMSTFEFDLIKGKRIEIFINTGIGFALNNVSSSQQIIVGGVDANYPYDFTFKIIGGTYYGDQMDICDTEAQGLGYDDYVGKNSIASGGVFVSNGFITFGELECIGERGEYIPASIGTTETEEVVSTVSSIPISFGLGMNYKFTKSFIWQIKAGYTNNTTILTETTFKNKVKTEVDFGNQSYTDITTGLIWRF